MTLMFMVSSVSAGDFFGGLFGKSIKGSGDRVTVERDIENFTRIKSRGSFDIKISVGEEPTLSITFDDNLVEFVTTKVHGKTLEIDSDGSFSSRKGCLIEITVPSLKQVRLSGSGDIEVYNLDSEVFEFKLSGSGDMWAEGKVDELEVSISGSGNIDTRDLIAQIVYAKVSGSGDISVYAKEELNARISGSGDIFYYRNKEYKSNHLSGSGDILKKR